MDFIYTDIQKAFDQIDHYILISKLKGYGLSDALVTLITSYLINRKHIVVHSECKSLPFTSTSGVPQSSNLSLNISKCYVVSFTRKRNVTYFDYSMGIETVCTTVKDLGISFDARLSFVEHVQHLTTSACSILGIICRNCKDFENVYSSILKLYYSSVRSR